MELQADINENSVFSERMMRLAVPRLLLPKSKNCSIVKGLNTSEILELENCHAIT
jgi:hypothetical protein